MRRVSKVVIGAGISGLLACFYDRRAVLIKGVRSNFDNPFIFVQKNKYTEMLVRDICLDIPVVSVKINNNCDQKSILSNKIYKKVDGIDYFGTDRIANAGRDDLLQVYNISEKNLCDILYSKLDANQIIDSSAVSIFPEDRIVEYCADGICEKICYDRLISTIPFKVFDKLCRSWSAGDKVACSDLYYSICKYDGNKSSISYFTDDAAVKVVNNGIVGLKGTEYNPTHPLYKDGDEIIVAKDARITGRINPPPVGIIFSGRFSTANPHWRIEDSIFLASDGIALSEIIDEQIRFDNVIKEKTKICAEDRIQKLILHAHSELTELLRETNWKMNSKSRKLIKATSVLEEGIDVTKLILSILMEYNYTPREIVEKFWYKSEINWENLITEFYGGVG